jgi:peptidoglycan-N-acetylglucosamine deacetylase
VAIADTVNIPELVRISPNGQLRLTAEKGRGIGPDIKYMPEWKAFGWFTAKDSIVWDVEVPSDGKYEVKMEWSVSDDESGKIFVLSTSHEEITGDSGKIRFLGNLQKGIQIGEIHLKKGYNRVVFKSGQKFEKGALLDLREITLEKIE